MLLLGIVTCFAGYRLFKFELFLVGFVIAGGLTYGGLEGLLNASGL